VSVWRRRLARARCARARWLVLLVTAGSGGAAHDVAGQDALVLSTGASRGFAHAGVLMALDSIGYDPDLVVGASMGAVIGALYASGRTPAEISQMLVATQWGDVFKPHAMVVGPSRQILSPAIRLGVNLATFEVSRGFIQDWRVNRLLANLLFEAGAASRGDFDRLPRRFRAVVADLSTGQEIVLAKGDLARAVRISMGTPGFFAPLVWDGRLLTDGGVANYLPISVARGLGASHIVAVDVSRQKPRIERTDPAAIGGRALGLLMRNAVRDTTADIMILPDIDGDASGAFFPADPTPLFVLGRTAALDAFPSPRARSRHPRSLPEAPTQWSGLEIEVNDPVIERMTARVLGPIAPGPFNPELLLKRIDRLFATGLVDGVWPRVEADGAGGGDVLVVQVDPVPSRSLSVSPGYENDRGGRIWADLQQRTQLGGAPLELSLAATATGIDRWGAASARLHTPGLAVSWVAGAHVRATETRLALPDSVPPQHDVNRGGGWISTEYRHVFPDRIASLTLHGEHVSVENGERGLSWGPSLRLATDVGNNLIVGVASEAEAVLRFGDVSYASAAVRTSRAFLLHDFVAAGVLDLTMTTGDAPPDISPALGDHNAMPGLRWRDERGEARLLAGFDLARAIMAAGTMRVRMRAGSAPSSWSDLGEADSWVLGAALEGIWSLPFGPILVGVGGNTLGKFRLNVNLGPVF
jgi:predicted acylesterase/phospholipase RssA